MRTVQVVAALALLLAAFSASLLVWDITADAPWDDKGDFTTAETLQGIRCAGLYDLLIAELTAIATILSEPGGSPFQTRESEVVRLNEALQFTNGLIDETCFAVP